MSAILPPGIDSLYDAPYTLQDAILAGIQIMGWEELPEDEVPPKRIWDEPDKLQKHFDWVKRKREAEMNPDKADIKDRPIEDPVDNDAASMLIGE